MFKEVVEIVPKMSSAELSNMEKSLSKRFVNAAKSFGHGLMNVIKGGAFAALLEKFLNPLKDIQDSIDKTLSRGSDIGVQAKAFGSTSGELAKLHAFGQASGLDDATMNLLVEKFHSAVTSATQNPGEHSAVRQFVGQTDMVQGFLTFSENLQKMTAVQRQQIEEEVLGARQVLRSAEFFQSNFQELNQKFAKLDTDNLTKSIDNISKIDNADKGNKAYNALKDLNDKSAAFNKVGDVAGIREKVDQAQLDKENRRIADFKDIQSAALKVDKIQEDLENLVKEVIVKLPIILNIMTAGTNQLSEVVKGVATAGDAIKTGWERFNSLHKKYQHMARKAIGLDK